MVSCKKKHEMDRILIVLLTILMSDHASSDEVVVGNPTQETPNSSVEVSGEARGQGTRG